MTELETKKEVWNLPIGERDTIKTLIYENPLKLNPNQLFSLGFRDNNTKRSFMFVSKVLGKHTPINPVVLGDMTKSLARVYYSDNLNINRELTDNGKIPCTKNTLIIGFAEAAVGLAQTFFDALEGDVSFVHSTRDTVEGFTPLFEFKETHSHAPAHNFYLLNDKLIKNAEEIIIVDDEVTSGNTAAAVIRIINALYPGKEYGLAAFLDWSDEDNKIFTQLKSDGIKIKCRSLLHGDIDLDKVVIPEKCEMPVFREVANYKPDNWNRFNLDFPKVEEVDTPFLRHTGRFGLSTLDRAHLNQFIIDSAEAIGKWLPEGKSLFLGTGEFLYIPLKLAEAVGGPVSFQSVTRTPNLPLIEKNYDIATLDIFPSPMAPERDEFIYNLQTGDFDNVVLFLERKWPMSQLNPLLSVLESKGFKSCNLVMLCE